MLIQTAFLILRFHPSCRGTRYHRNDADATAYCSANKDAGKFRDKKSTENGVFFRDQISRKLGASLEN